MKYIMNIGDFLQLFISALWKFFIIIIISLWNKYIYNSSGAKFKKEPAMFNIVQLFSE